MVHACCFHTGSASFCVACRNDSTIFSPCQPFLRKKLLRTCGRRERPPALCALWAWSPLACGRVPYPPYARCGMGRLCGERRRRKRFERPSGARNAACSTAPLATPGLPPAPAAGRSAARARSRRGRRVPAPTARAMGAQRPRASVSSAHLAQETRLAAPRSCPRRATLLRTARQKPRRARPLPPRQARLRAHRSRHGCATPLRKRFERPSGARNAACSTAPLATPGLPPAPAVRGLEGRNPPSEIVSPGSAGRAGSLRPWAQTFLTRFPGRAEGAGETCAPRRKRSPTASFSDARRQAELFRRPTAVCRSSPRCPR